MTSKGEQSLVVFKQKAVLSAREIISWTKFYSSLIQYGKNLNISTQSCMPLQFFKKIYMYVCMYLNIFPLITSYLPPLTNFKRQKDVWKLSVSYIKMHERETASPFSHSLYHHKYVCSRYRQPEAKQFKMWQHQRNSDIRQVLSFNTRALSPLHGCVRRERPGIALCKSPISHKLTNYPKGMQELLFCPYSLLPSSHIYSCFYYLEVSQVQFVSFRFGSTFLFDQKGRTSK